MYKMGRKDLKKGIIDRPIRFRTSLSNTIADVMRNRGWQEVTVESTQPNEWDIHWCDREWLKDNYDHSYFQEHVKICHFRNHYELTRKNLMVKNLRRMRKLVEREQGKGSGLVFDFYPTTFELPSEYHIFVEEFKKCLGHIWIMKPVARSQGKGIFLFKKLKDITDWKKGEYNANPDPALPIPETYVVQRYIHNPYLVNGRKFDIRIYVLVTSYNPLKVWLYRSGFARFSNTRYSLESIDDSYIHLTNVAVQKTAPDYDPEKGCKWSTQQLRRYLTAKHGVDKADKAFAEMDSIFIKSLQSVQKVIINDKHCFEMYGYDILLDENLKPWLIEINASPSLTASNREDYELKYGLLTDVLNIIDLEGRLSGKEKRIGGFDLIWEDGQVMEEDGLWDSVCISSETPNSFLGCHNDRERQLTQLYKMLALTKTKSTAATVSAT